MNRRISKRFPVLNNGLITIREIDTWRVEEIVPKTLCWDNDPARAVTQNGNLADSRRERNVLR